MESKSSWLILVGGSCPLGKEAADVALASGMSVVSIDRAPAVGQEEASTSFFEIIGDLSDASVIQQAFGYCKGADSVSIVYIASGRKEINNPLGIREASRLQMEALQVWAREYLDAAVVDKSSGVFILISSVNSVLQSHSDPIYGALKAAAESLMRSFAIIANSRGYGAFLTLRLGYVEYSKTTEADNQIPSRMAAQMVLGKRLLPSWRDVAKALCLLSRLEGSILNGSTLWGDYGAHLREQTHIGVEAIELLDRFSQ